METSTLNTGRAVGEEDLVRSAQAGNLQAFEELYRSMSGRIHTLCLRLTADPVLAEDLTQDAFVRIWQRLSSFRGDSAFATWCHRLTVRLAIDRLRAEKRRGKWMHEDIDLDTLKSATRGRDSTLAIDLERAIAALPPGARTVFVLHDVEGYRHAEIGEMTRTSEGACKAQLHRARRLLREAIRR